MPSSYHKDKACFLHLLRHALWAEPLQAERFRAKKVSWSRLLQLVESHAMLGLLADSMLSLPKDVRLKEEDRMGVLAFRQQCLERNALINDCLNELSAVMTQYSFSPILLKGQGNALCYPHPMLRTSGDIDLYVGEEQFEKVSLLVLSLAHQRPPVNPFWRTSQKHLPIRWGDVYLEVHRCAESALANPEAEGYMQELNEHWLTPELSKPVSIAGAETLIPAPQFNVFYIFVHVCNHLLEGGVGMRKVVDWVMALHHYHGQYDVETLKNDLQATGYWTAWQVMSCIAVDALGTPEAEVPFYTPGRKQTSQQLLRQILMTGNFGVSGGSDTICRGWRRPLSTYIYYKRWYRSGVLLYRLFPQCPLYGTRSQMFCKMVSNLGSAYWRRLTDRISHMFNKFDTF